MKNLLSCIRSFLNSSAYSKGWYDVYNNDGYQGTYLSSEILQELVNMNACKIDEFGRNIGLKEDYRVVLNH